MRERRHHGARCRRRAGAAGRAVGQRARGLAGLGARPLARRPCHERRAARARRPPADARHLLQGRSADRSAAGIRQRAPRARRSIASTTSRASRRPGPRLGTTPRSERRLALVLSDYPARGGRTGYAVGLDTAASAAEILQLLQRRGLRHRRARLAGSRHRAPAAGQCRSIEIPMSAYRAWLKALPPEPAARACRDWGEPAGDAFRLPVLRCGNVLVLLQPDRGALGDRKSGYHDTNCPPSHAYVALYAWLREIEKIDALIHLGTHGTLEWLPGKALALVGRMLARGGAGRAAGDLSLHRQQSRRGGAGQAAAGRRHHRPSDAAAQRRRPARAAGRAGRHHRGICRGRRPRPAAHELPRGRDRRARLEQRPRRRLRPAARASPTGRPSPSSTPSSATSRSSASATACMSSAARPTRRRCRRWRGDRPRGGRARLRRRRACGAPRRARRPPRGAGSGRRAVARPRRRAADRPQPHLDRSARHPDPHRRRDRRARGRRGRAPLPAGSRRAAARAGHRSLGLGVAAHRRRRSRPGAVPISACSRPGTRRRAASPASRSCRWPCSTGRAST